MPEIWAPCVDVKPSPGQRNEATDSLESGTFFHDRTLEGQMRDVLFLRINSGHMPHLHRVR
jgi:hypothetical protein